MGDVGNWIDIIFKEGPINYAEITSCGYTGFTISWDSGNNPKHSNRPGDAAVGFFPKPDSAFTVTTSPTTYKFSEIIGYTFPNHITGVRMKQDGATILAEDWVVGNMSIKFS